jgi:hypothetical protein
MKAKPVDKNAELARNPNLNQMYSKQQQNTALQQQDVQLEGRMKECKCFDVAQSKKRKRHNANCG